MKLKDLKSGMKVITNCTVYVPKNEGLLLSRDIDNFNLIWKREEHIEPTRFELNKEILDEVLGILRQVDSKYNEAKYELAIDKCRRVGTSNPGVSWVVWLNLLSSITKLGATNDTVYDFLKMLDCEVINIGN